VSELGALPETIGGGEKFTGWCVPAGDAAALADCIKSVLALSPAERAAVGARGRERVGALFDLAQMQMKTLAVYDELLGGNLAEVYENPPAFAAMAGS
jgi:glycosyltransferase involved in cell wall biosynthesis